MSVSPRAPNPFDHPAIYQISVRGRIDPGASDLLDGLAINQPALDVGYPVTILQGELCDQAALVGVLNTIYELQLTVLSVMRLEK